MTPPPTALACLLLRAGLGYFLLVWGLNKFLAAEQSVRLYRYFYGVEIGETVPFFLGAGETAVAFMVLLGLWRPVAYGLGLLIHGTTVAVILPRLADPFLIVDGFPQNRPYAAAVPALAAFAVLFLLRHHDRWSLDHWWAARGERAPSS